MIIRIAFVCRSPTTALRDYVRGAEALNAGRFDVVCLQHEFGIFGGEAGSHILALLSRLEMPVVTTLHTVLAEPTAAQRGVLTRIVEISAKVVVMAEKGRELLNRVYGVPMYKDRGDPSRHSRYRLLRARRDKAEAWVRRPLRHPDIRTAVAQQGYRGDDRCHAADPAEPAGCSLRRSGRNPPQSRSQRGRGLS